MTYEDITKNSSIRTYIEEADRSLLALGSTEHSFAHVTTVATRVEYILKTLGADERSIELGKIAGYLHDIGNLVNRVDHSQSGAIMAFRLLDKMGFDPKEIALITTAIGNHDEGTGVPVNSIAAALIIADKSDVRRTRVRNRDISTFDIHDRVNYSVTKTDLSIDPEKKEILLKLSINTEICTITDYFEIFLERMMLCRKSAEILGTTFKLTVNGRKVL